MISIRSTIQTVLIATSHLECLSLKTVSVLLNNCVLNLHDLFMHLYMICSSICTETVPLFLQKRFLYLYRNYFTSNCSMYRNCFYICTGSVPLFVAIVVVGQALSGHTHLKTDIQLVNLEMSKIDMVEFV